MKITFYGTRGVFPPGSQMSCAWVDAPAGPFVIDLGSSDLLDDPSRVDSIDHVLLTHLHSDHIAMLPRLLAVRPDCLFVAPEPVPGGGGVRQVDGVPAQWCGLRLEVFQTNHRKKNFAYKLSGGSSVVVWTGDGSYSVELAGFCRGADAIICEATVREMPEAKAIALGHMSPSLFARLMNEAVPARAIATHFSELEPAEYLAEVRKHLKVGIDLIAAQNGLVLDFS